MTNWNKLIIYSILIFFVFILIQDQVDAKRSSNKVEKVKDRQSREEKHLLKKEGKKIKKSFSKKYEQLYFSLCPDCYTKLAQASENCSQNYEKLNLPKERIDKCKDKSKEKSKKKRKNLDNSIDDNMNLKGPKDVFERENKFLNCLFDALKDQEKYRSLSKDEFKKERNNLTNQLLQDKTECIKKQLQTGSQSENNRTN